MNLEGARVLLVGASGGIGAATARELAAAGARLALAGRRREALERVAAELPAAALILTGDITDEAGRIALVAEAVRELGGLDLLINAAGVLDFVPFAEQSQAALQRIFDTNVLAPMALVRAALPYLREGGGRVVNVGSTFGSIAFPYFAAYSASKFALRGFSEALRRELGGVVGVTYVAPRATRTAINGEAVMRMGKAVGMNMDAPEVVARAIVRALRKDRDEAYFGWPEALFVRINALLPRLVDRALRGQTRTMGEYARS